MRFDSNDEADSSEVEDRRGNGLRFPGGGMGAGAGGLGLLGLIIVGVVKLLGGNVELSSGEQGGTVPGAGPSGPLGPSANNARQPGASTTGDLSSSAGVGSGPSLSGSCAGVTSATDAAKFIVCVETNVQAFWRADFAKSRAQYQGAKLVLFTDATESGCGEASAATGPFYCPPDQKVYLDLGFFDELHKRFHAKGGDFAEAYVVAHEYGHHIQNLRGTEAKVRQAQRAHPSQRNDFSVRLELQADCYAGVWGHSAYEKGKVARQEIADALDAAAAVGDDRIQKEMRGRVNPESFTHGSAADRQKWFGIGMESGDAGKCDTFSDGQ